MLGSCIMSNVSGHTLLNNENSAENINKLKSRVSMMKTYQKLNGNEVLLNNLEEIEGIANDVQNPHHTIGNRIF